jgi:primosomal protein N''
MEENNTKEISLIDLIKLFQKKFKALVLIALIAAIVGGAAGVFLNITGATYSADLEIYMTPADGSDRLLYDLRSGRFAEQLLLEENGLPAKELCNAADYEAAERLLTELEVIRQARIDKHEEISRYYTSDIEHQYAVLTNEYNNILSVLKMYKDAQTDGLVNESHLAVIADYERRLQEAEDEKKAYYDEVYSKVENKKIQMNTELAELSDQLSDKREEAEEAVEKVLAAWRDNEDVAKQVTAILKFATYEYHKLSYFEKETQADKNEDDESLHRGYIKIQLVVPASAIPEGALEGMDYVEDLIDRYNNRMGDYVEDYLEKATGAYEAKCTVISPIVNIETTESAVIGEAVKFAAIAGIAGGVLAYLFFVVQMLMKENDEAKAQKENAVAKGTPDSSAK